ncbi:MAG: hypothetical protein ACF8TS_10830 [Maioricimonas sp. JB049]
MPVSGPRRPTLIVLVVLIGVLLRAGIMLTAPERLLDDRDTYVGLATGIAEGRGFSIPGTTQPTAYRPVLYPLLLSIGIRWAPSVWIAAVNLLAAAATIVLTWLLARRLSLDGRGPLIAATLIAVDPLLALYTAYPMTEMFFTALVAALLVCAFPPGQRGRPYSWRRAVAVGGLFGLAALSRPSVWAFGGLWAAMSLLHAVWRRFCHTGEQPALRVTNWVIVAGTALLVVAPWGIRNWMLFERPILMTTHGGYTILLGNNAAFYEEVVAQPLGTVWDGSQGPGQGAWVSRLHAEMDAAGLETDLERDRFMSRRAWETIREHPLLFVRASLLRLLRFWNIVPSGPSAEAVPPALRWSVGFCYAVYWLLALGGAWHALRSRDVRWWTLVLLAVSFSLVHTLYWSNARMRAPVMPAVAVLAAWTCERRTRHLLHRSIRVHANGDERR